MLGGHDDTKMWARQDPQSQAVPRNMMCRHPGSLAFSKVLAIREVLSTVNYMLTEWWPDCEPEETHNPEKQWQGQK